MSLDPTIAKERQQGIAATDAAPIAGLSPLKSAADVWVEKKHPHLIQKDDPTPEMKWGTKLEDLIRQEYALQTKATITAPGLVKNFNIPWIMCQPDGQVQGKFKKGLECKTAGAYQSHAWGKSGTDQVPPYYLIQVMHSMMVTGWREWDVAALIGGNDFRIYHLFWNMDVIKELYEIEKEFYYSFIKGNLTPPIDWGKNVKRFASAKWPRHKDGEIFDVDKNGDDTIKEALLKLVAARDAQDKGLKEEEVQGTLVQAYMKDAEFLAWAEGKLKISWKNIKGTTKIDWESIYNEIIQFCTLSAEEKAAAIKRHSEEKEGVRRFTVYDKERRK